ncbi:hypothetical protein M9Y10_029141 [Tritrichomonas musculus]|uniref:Uncharacterized protein n=1 Tax=Tritrichomonas musculus TaxID=1915356 RepID=A0ABR2KLD7_9EUKA
METYKDNNGNPLTNSFLIDYGGKIKRNKKNELISSCGIFFDHLNFQNTLSKGSYSDKDKEVSKFIDFYSYFKFELDDQNVESIQLILSIIEQREPNSKDLVLSCFSALNCLLNSKVKSSVLLNFHILQILHPYLANPNAEDIIPTLQVVNHLLSEKEHSRVFSNYSISIFKMILLEFDAKQIDEIIYKILFKLFKIISKQKDINSIILNTSINDIFSAIFVIFERERKKFISNPREFKSSILNSYLNLLYILIQNKRGIIPDMNAKPTTDSISPMDFFKFTLENLKRKSIEKTLLILTEIIYVDFNYFYSIDLRQISYHLNSKFAQVQSASINFFYSILQALTNSNDLTNEIKNLHVKISQMEVFPNLFNLFISDQLFYQSKVISVQLFDALFNILPNSSLDFYYDRPLIDYLCSFINDNLDDSALISILNIFIMMMNLTNDIKKNFLIQETKALIDENTIDIFLQSNDPNVRHKADYFFRFINESN